MVARMTRWLAAAALAAVLAVAGWLGWRHFRAPPPPVLVQSVPLAEGDEVEGVETVVGDAAPLPTGGTPMAQRVAVLGLLNKRNSESREVTLRPGQATRIGDVVIRLAACEETAPWETDPLTGAFVQLDVRGAEGRWGRVFSGWLFKERPGLNVVQHPVYDVWTKSCTMSWPDGGPDTTVLSGPRPASTSSASNRAPASAATTPAPPSSAPPSADASSDR
jgi:hypothetical protein